MARWRFWQRGSTPSTGTVADSPARRAFGGRQFAAGVPYVLPRDIQEINRLDFQHYMLRQALRGNYAAPLGEPRDVLDVGCGTGRWAMEMAATFPTARVVGIDVVPPPADDPATPGARPANFVYMPGNVLEGLPVADASFDFVHQRLLVFALPADRWMGVVRELARITRPGGWVELVEGRPVRGGGPALELLHAWVSEMSARRGIDMLIGNQIGAFLQTAGLANVTQNEVPIPLGQHGGRLGAMAETDYFTGFNAIRPLIVAQGLASEQGFEEALAAARAEVARGQYMWSYFVAYGRRM